MKNIYPIVALLLTLTLTACQNGTRKVVEANEKFINIDSTLDAIQDQQYVAELQPLKQQLNEQLDGVICYAPQPLTIALPECTMLNFATDALFDMAVHFFNEHNKPALVDLAVVNRGGMRCEWTAGDITKRSVFELMPFDNKLVLITLTGQDLIDLFNIFAQQGGQGVSRQVRFVIAKNQQGQAYAKNITISGKPIEPQAVYYVATSDYLSTGTDNMTPLAKYIDKLDTGYLIRQLYIDYLQLLTANGKQLTPQLDGRITIE